MKKYVDVAVVARGDLLAQLHTIKKRSKKNEENKKYQIIFL